MRSAISNASSSPQLVSRRTSLAVRKVAIYVSLSQGQPCSCKKRKQSSAPTRAASVHTLLSKGQLLECKSWRLCRHPARAALNAAALRTRAPCSNTYHRQSTVEARAALTAIASHMKSLVLLYNFQGSHCHERKLSSIMSVLRQDGNPSPIKSECMSRTLRELQLRENFCRQRIQCCTNTPHNRSTCRGRNC